MISGRERALLLFVSAVACTTTGKMRADANTLLRVYGLPTIPLSGNYDSAESKAAQDAILKALDRLSADSLEIAPSMTEAGLSVYEDLHLTFPAHLLVGEIYKAMWRARGKDETSPSPNV